jgi:probable rRNA maturation factor
VLAYESDDEEPGYLGDVVVSVDTAARQAEEAGRPLREEVAWLAAHGVLHLLGHDDETDADREAMIALQDRALQEAPGEGGLGQA